MIIQPCAYTDRQNRCVSENNHFSLFHFLKESLTWENNTVTDTDKLLWDDILAITIGMKHIYSQQDRLTTLIKCLMFCGLMSQNTYCKIQAF